MQTGTRYQFDKSSRVTHLRNLDTHTCMYEHKQTRMYMQVRHLLKLSPEKWDEVAQHAQGAVMPDFRPRAWWCPLLRAGLLFGTKNGSVCMDQPIGACPFVVVQKCVHEVFSSLAVLFWWRWV
jgi:hypothetical protein